MSLADFAERHADSGQYKPGRPCTFCSIPEPLQSEIRQALLTGERSQQMIVDYLVEDHHIEATLSMLQGHIRNGHVAGYKKRRR